MCCPNSWSASGVRPSASPRSGANARRIVGVTGRIREDDGSWAVASGPGNGCGKALADSEASGQGEGHPLPPTDSLALCVALHVGNVDAEESLNRVEGQRKHCQEEIPRFAKLSSDDAPRGAQVKTHSLVSFRV